MFDKFRLYIDAKKQFNYQLDMQQERNFAVFLEKEIQNKEFIAQYIEYEKTAMANKSNQNMPICRLLLDEVAFYPDQQNPKWESFESYVDCVKKMLQLLPVEVLDREITLFNIDFLGKFTTLSLSVDYLLKLYTKNREKNLSNSLNYQTFLKYQELQSIWKKEIIDPLLTIGCSPDKGACNNESLLAACFREYLPSEVDQCISALTEFLLEHSKKTDEPNNFGSTALTIAVLRDFPEEIIFRLVKKGADINRCFRETLFNKTEQPLACYLIRHQKYEKLKLILNLGADPNLIPKSEGYVFTEQLKQETWLSPFQLAVALDDETAISIIQEIATKKNIELIADLSEQESKRDALGLSNFKLRYQAKKLFLNCNSQLFKSNDHMLTQIYQSFGVKCYVKKQSDRENMSKALSWLLEKAPQSAAGRFWTIAWNYFVQESSQNSKFAIFTSSAPQKITKNSACAGLLNEGIQIGCDLPTEIIIDTIAHEIGHLVDQKSFNIPSIMSAVSKEVQSLAKAITKDLSQIIMPIDAEQFTSNFWLKARLEDFETQYKGERTHEYFTYIFFELPINYARCNPSATEKDLLCMMQKYFPSSLEWFLSHESMLINNFKPNIEMKI